MAADLPTPMYVKGSVASKALGVDQQTLRKLANEGKIRHFVLPSGQRRYDVESVSGDLRKAQRAGADIIYARVSSAGQKDDLQRQVGMLVAAYPGHEVVEDIGSGIDFKRKGLQTVLGRAMHGEVRRVVVAHRDRLARFAFDLVAWILRKHGVELVVHEPSVDTPEKELVDDLLSIVTVFASRAYGRRKYGKRAREEQAEGEQDARDQGVPVRG